MTRAETTAAVEVLPEIASELRTGWEMGDIDRLLRAYSLAHETVEAVRAQLSTDLFDNARRKARREGE